MMMDGKGGSGSGIGSGADGDDSFLNHPPIVDATDTDTATATATTTNGITKQDTHKSKANANANNRPAPSIINDLIGAALSLSSTRTRKSTSASTRPGTGISTSTSSQDAIDMVNENENENDDGDDEELQSKPLITATMKDVHELLGEQREGILEELNAILDQRKAHHREKMQKLESHIITSRGMQGIHGIHGTRGMHGGAMPRGTQSMAMNMSMSMGMGMSMTTNMAMRGRRSSVVSPSGVMAGYTTGGGMGRESVMMKEGRFSGDKKGEGGGGGGGEEIGDGYDDDYGHDYDYEEDDDKEAKEYTLENDVYSLMMLNGVTSQYATSSPFWRRIKQSVARLCIALCVFIWIYIIHYVFAEDPMFDLNNSSFQDEYILYVLSAVLFWLAMSSTWFLGTITFIIFQLFLALCIIDDQLFVTKRKCEEDRRPEEVCIPFNIPIWFDPVVTSVQYISAVLVLATQTDVLTSIFNVLHLRNAPHVPWDKVIGVEGNRTWPLWIVRILIPNVLKFIQAFVILLASFVIIVQNVEIVELLKDFTAVLVVSQSDNIMFSVADMGYLGKDLAQKTAEVKATHWTIYKEEKEEDQTKGDDEAPDTGAHTGTGAGTDSISCSSRVWKRFKRSFDIRVFIFSLLCVMMIGGISYIKILQVRGTLARMKYPNCTVRKPQFIGDGYCHDWYPMNTEACGYDGGDCDDEPKQVDGYPDCFVRNTFDIGNGFCNDWAPYNTAECGYDGGDCAGDLLQVDGYPDCFVRNPFMIGSGFCDNDMGDGHYNTPECGFDGGDCDGRNPVEGYPECFVLYPESLGDGDCNKYPPYNTSECGFDGGDCLQ